MVLNDGQFHSVLNRTPKHILYEILHLTFVNYYFFCIRPTLIRTIWSIHNRSPHQLIHEIILVDDFSTEQSLKKPLDTFVNGLAVQVKIIRTDKREGLIRARLIGARAAKVGYKLLNKIFFYNKLKTI